MSDGQELLIEEWGFILGCKKGRQVNRIAFSCFDNFS